MRERAGTSLTGPSLPSGIRRRRLPAPATTAAAILPLFITLLSGCSTKSFNYALASADNARAPEPPAVAALFDPLAPLYPDTDIGAGSPRFASDVFPGTWVSAAVVAVPSGTEGIGIGVDAPPGFSIEVNELLDVPVLENTGFFGMTEKGLGFENRHVVRHAPFRIYEVLSPAETGRYPGGSPRAFFLRLRIPEDADPGPLSAFVTVSDLSGGTRTRLEWDVAVHPVTLPRGEGNELLYTNWFKTPREGFGEIFDDEWWRLTEDYVRFMREGGQNVAYVPREILYDAGADGEARVNLDRLDRFMTICEEYGFLAFEGPPPGRRKNGILGKEIIVRLYAEQEPREPFQEETSAILRRNFAPLGAFLEERGSAGSWLQHVIDEPMRKHADAYAWIAGEIRASMPGVRTMDATKTRRSLVGSVDVWCPLVSEYQKHRGFFEKRTAEGEDVWIYSCMIPGGAWLNRTMDQERLRSVYVGWGCALYGLDGYLRWDLNKWRDDQDIWEGELPGEPGDLVKRPFGDGFAVFPGPEGTLLSTTRWEAGRVGMEDYRLLRLLESRDPAGFERIVALCFTDFKTYETDPAAYRDAKRRLLEALSES